MANIQIYTLVFAQKKSIFFAGEKQYIHLTLKYTQKQINKLCEDIYKGCEHGKRNKSLNLIVFLPQVEFDNTILVPEYVYPDVIFCDWEVVNDESIKCIFQIANQEFDAPMVDNKPSLFATLKEVAEHDPFGEYTDAAAQLKYIKFSFLASALNIKHFKSGFKGKSCIGFTKQIDDWNDKTLYLDYLALELFTEKGVGIYSFSLSDNNENAIMSTIIQIVKDILEKE